MPAKTSPRIEPAGAEYVYRRSLNVQEMLPAIGAGVVTGAVTFYLAYLWLQRTPLVPRARPPASAPRKSVAIRPPTPARTLGG